MNPALDAALTELYAAVAVGAPLDDLALRFRRMRDRPATGTSEDAKADLLGLVVDLERAHAEGEHLHPDLRAQLLKRIDRMRCE